MCKLDKIKKSQSDCPTNRSLSPQVDIDNLNLKQLQAYNIVSTHYTNHRLYNLCTNSDIHPLHMLMLGTAGTGKSYLIYAPAQLLQDKCLLTATTGIAAFHIGGITLHSAPTKLTHSRSTSKGINSQNLRSAEGFLLLAEINLETDIFPVTGVNVNLL